jgi:hypothetical protein
MSHPNHFIFFPDKQLARDEEAEEVGCITRSYLILVSRRCCIYSDKISCTIYDIMFMM